MVKRNLTRPVVPLALVLTCLGVARQGTAAEQPQPAIVIPHAQSEPPGPPLSPAEAVARMTVPEGFSVELVAHEPDIINPVAMTFDHRGRIWITESLEYPRRSPGPGRDRIKILEDTDGDGRADKFTIFAEGLNIPSGIAVGYGGVWVANAPDILFLQDTDGDDKADRQEVVVTGFGRTDTHELPNSLTWGPDGWLYGLNGVFNHSHVKHRGQDYRFTCAMFRIHPRTREFQLFCEGTSNPWGIAFDPEGNAFISACVIDHLWHLTESGYYHRQGGPYPPYTWKLGSIVRHKHQKAAYCGLTYFDSDAYPPAYRDKLYMGNIHGGCINVDYLTRDGATYLAKPDPDFLTANDVWFMPVVQKTGPDGCLYVLDWYDRYHCYQDANRDPEGIDRGRGRLYRVRYAETPRADAFDLQKETNAQLVNRLASPNIYFRETAQRLLAERMDDPTRRQLQQVVLNDASSRKQKMHALWALVSSGSLAPDFHEQLAGAEDPAFRSWAVRAAGNFGKVSAPLAQRIRQLSRDPSPDVRLQVAIAAPKLAMLPTADVLLEVLAASAEDKLIPSIVWQNLHPLLGQQPVETVARITDGERLQYDAVVQLLPRVVDRLLGGDAAAVTACGQLLQQILTGDIISAEIARRGIDQVRRAILQGAVTAEASDRLQKQLGETLRQVYTNPQAPLASSSALLAAMWDDLAARERVYQLAAGSETPSGQRLEALEVLAALNDPQTISLARPLLSASQEDEQAAADMLGVLSRLQNPQVATMLLEQFDSLAPGLQPQVVELLCQRSSWTIPLLQRIQQQTLSPDLLHINQLRRLQQSKDEQVQQLVQQIWGTVREGRNPAAEETIQHVRELFARNPGDPQRGRQVFAKTCAQCHQMYNEGQQVGPDITRNGRGSFDQLLSNVFDPNLVIGSAYQARTVITADGRTLTGLLVEESPQRVVLKMQGAKEAAIPRSEIDELVVSPLSLMPEGWEKQLSEQELVDLLSYLTLDAPPNDPQAQPLPGTPRPE